jgi:4a-hydroxytetrahydrobiopterin dehydratase
MNAQRHTSSTFSTFSAPVSCTPQGLMGATALLTPAQIKTHHKSVPQWQVVQGHHLQRTFTFDKFSAAQTFTQHVENISQMRGQLPHLFVTFDAVRIELWTHAFDGLTADDFALAEQIDAALELP